MAIAAAIPTPARRAIAQVQLRDAVAIGLGQPGASAFYAGKGATFVEEPNGITVTTPKGSATIPWSNLKAIHWGPDA